MLENRLYHYAMSRALESIAEPGRTGMYLRDPSGNIRNGFPLLAGHLADNPEQVLIACTRKRRSPITLASYKDLDSPVRFPPRTRDHTLTAIQRSLVPPKSANYTPSLSSYLNGARKLDLNGVTKPFWAALPHANPSTFLVSDILHQLHRFFLDHPFQWFRAIVGSSELDKRIASVQHVVGLKHFPSLSNIGQWTGTEQRQLQRVLLPCVAGAPNVTPRATRFLRSVLDIIYLAQYPSHTETTFQAIRNAIATFHEEKSEIVRLGQILVPEKPKKKKKNAKPLSLPKHFRIPKVEMLHNLEPCIREMGSLPQFSTETTEYLHGPLVKDPFRHCNGQNATDGMCRILDRREKVADFQEYLKWRGEEKARRKSLDGTGGLGQPSKCDESVLSDRLENSRISITKKPHRSRITIDDAASLYGLPDLRAALADYFNIATEGSRPRGKRRIAGANAELPFALLDVWYHFRLTPSGELESESLPETIRASPPNKNEPFGLCNTVLINGNDPSSGLRGKLVTCEYLGCC
jgi:hypothetical protein